MIKVDQYARRMGLFDMHIDLLRQSLQHFSKDKEAVEVFIAQQEQKYSKGIDVVLAIDKDRERDFVDDMIVKAQGNRLRREIQHHAEFAENKINQMELVLRCAYFEAEMKDIHRHCLYEEPTLLKPDRKIDLGRLVAKDEGTVIEEEIESEVKRLDAESTRNRASYFMKTLKLDWGNPMYPDPNFRIPHQTCVDKIDEITKLRNKVVHEESDHVVSLDTLQEARRYYTFVPNCCCLQAAKLYPSQFSEK